MEADPNQESFEELYEESPCGYVSTLPDGVIVRANRTFLSWIGYSADELVAGTRFPALLTMPSALLYETHCAPLLRLRGSIGEISLDLLCRDGRPMPVLFTAAAKKDAAGAPCRFRIVVLNAPTRREYERELLRARLQAEEATEQVHILRELAEDKVAEQQALLHAVAGMAAGDLDTPVPIDSKSSQAQLAAGLDQMRLDIRQQFHQLKERNTEVQQLNVELQHQIEQRSRLLIESMVSELKYGGASGSTDSAAEALPLLPAGTLLGQRYSVKALLGQGAMGTVYEVERISDHRFFAAKVLSVKPEFQARVRLTREAQLLARLRHPNLISVVDVDITEDRLTYIIMELARGPSLADFSSRYGDRDFILPILLQIAAALTVVHDAAIVHRDLKPANVLIIAGTGGEPALSKLVDFGVSRLIEGPQDAPEATVPPDANEGMATFLSRGVAVTLDDPLRASATAATPRELTAARPVSQPPTDPLSQPSASPGLAKRRSRAWEEQTQAGVIFGTPRYMAPELSRGASLARPSSDIFSFGVMAYEILAGHFPFDELPVLRAAQGASELPYRPLDTLCAGLSAELARVLEGCLAIDPARRPTARELAEVLARTL